ADRQRVARRVRGRGGDVLVHHVAANGQGVFPFVERQADPPRRDVAVRLSRRAVHAAVVVVGGRDRLLRRLDQRAVRTVDARAVPEQRRERHAGGGVGAGAVERGRRQRGDVDQ